MKTSKMLKIASNHQNKLLTAQFSLVENIRYLGIASIDMADFVQITAHSRAMFLILEKQVFTKLDHPLKKIIIDDLPKNIKSIWIDIWIGTAASEDYIQSDMCKIIIDNLINLLPDNIEVIIVDTSNPDSQQSSISIIAFD